MAPHHADEPPSGNSEYLTAFPQCAAA
jgi:hypothetical protein